MSAADCWRRVSRLQASAALVCIGIFAAASADALGPRDRLWALLACVDPARRGEQCIKPRADEIENRHPTCPATTQVWLESAAYVAIRDQRMCNCPAEFVHGLALPFARLSGIEADHLPEGIWRFAWDAARTKIEDEDRIVLTVNPPAQRTQDQLHIHLVRRRDGACEEFPAGSTVSVPTLDHVWEIAKSRAKERHLRNYGLLVTRCSKDAFTILVEEVSQSGGMTPESRFTQHDCSKVH